MEIIEISFPALQEQKWVNAREYIKGRISLDKFMEEETRLSLANRPRPVEVDPNGRISFFVRSK